MTIVALAALAPTPAAASSIDFASLPEVRLSTVPGSDDAPKSISRARKIAGLWLVQPPRAHRRRSGRQVGVFSDRDAASVYAKQGYYPNGRGEPRVCFSTVQVAQGPLAGDPWPLHQASRGQLYADGSVHGRKAKKRGEHITALHAEELVIGDDGTATLKTMDAWVDPWTLGARLIERRSTELARIAGSTAGVAVYAGRAGATVEFVVTAATVDHLEEAERASARNMMNALRVELGDQGGSSDCGHATVRLGVALAGGAEANVVVQVPLSVGNAKQREMELRPLSVFLSVSRTKSERAPVPSVSFGWAGEGRRINF